MTGAYLRLAAAATYAASKTNLAKLDLFSRAILDFVSIEHAAKRDLRVMDVVMRYKAIATAPTIYARLSNLEEDGWIYYRADPGDGRCKLIRPTDRARAVYAKIDKEISKAMEVAA